MNKLKAQAQQKKKRNFAREYMRETNNEINNVKIHFFGNRQQQKAEWRENKNEPRIFRIHLEAPKTGIFGFNGEQKGNSNGTN